jgi:nucleoid DNA-binding protein
MQEIIVSLIEESLLSYDCVIIPQFGGFVLNTKGFLYDEDTLTIYPKRKWVAFNERLQADDGLLAMALAQKTGLKQKEAFKEIHEFAIRLSQRIKSGETFELGNVGTFTLGSESNIKFEPKLNTNFDLAQFGLIPVQIKQKPVKPTLIPNPVVESLVDLAPVTTKPEEKRLSFQFYTYVILSFLFVGSVTYFLTEPNARYASSSMSPLIIKIKKKEIIKAPIITHEAKASVKEARVEKNEISVPELDIFLVAGSFLTKEKAMLSQLELVNKGFSDVEILEKQEGEKHFRVSVGRVANFDLGYQKAAEIKEEMKLDIWVFKKQ